MRPYVETTVRLGIAMATFYLSSTYEDLKDYRRVVYEALRKAGHHVIAMEDYVAADQRPVDKCLKDVEAADIYIGLFAFRYGYVPPAQHDNPKGLSITELEYRRAEALKKPCLTFAVSDTTAWPRVFDDAYTAEDKGERIKALRQHLLTEKLASQFAAPHELSTLVLAAAAKHLADRKQPESAEAQGSGRVAAITWDSATQGSPYPGLMHFNRKYAPVFFGRTAEVREVLDRMQGPQGRFIIVSGNSGVGKSSLIDAGLLPKLEQGGLSGGVQCECVRMVPSQRTDPWSSLLVAIGGIATRAGLRPDEIVDALNRKPDSLSEHLTRIIKNGLEGRALVLFLDQMEELFTAQDQTKAQQFLAALYRAAQENRLWVLATIRSDHLHHCHDSPDMRAVLGGAGHYPLGPIEPYMVEDLIVKPAGCAGVRVSEELARRIVYDAGAEPGNLPLLAFLLNQLFEKRKDHELTTGVYATLGGVAGAIKQHAEQVERGIQEKSGEKTLAHLPTLFRSLVTVSVEGVPTRRRPLLREFPEMKGLIKSLVDARLLHTEGQDEEATVSISHEKLFEVWPSLKAYVEVNKKQLIDQRLLESRAQKWEELGKPWFDGLASGREYQDFRRSMTAATPLMKAYLDASSRAKWIQAGAIGLVMLFVSGAGAWLWTTGLTLEQALLRGKSYFMSIHIAPVLETVPAGTFRQGKNGGKFLRADPVHEVSIKTFAMGKYEVTFEEYDRFAIAERRLLPHDQGWGRNKRPVINVSWQDAKDYAAWLSQKTGTRYRLPSESEWEYAARSGAKQEDWAGTSNEAELGEYAVFSNDRTAEVGTKKANGFRLHDLSGNVWEWVEDCWHETYQQAPANGSAWMEANNGNCGRRVLRGGSWYLKPVYLRASFRDRYDADTRDDGIGFRLVQDLEP
ncbi:MAG: SUMF1/EgtB/PvdO family nonheme iron enzyme [Nitrospira sp.]|nr:SUMF1/EgtB/PvdO family nonheme iron enzyme [Nitrospira sp.]